MIFLLKLLQLPVTWILTTVRAYFLLATLSMLGDKFYQHQVACWLYEKTLVDCSIGQLPNSTHFGKVSLFFPLLLWGLIKCTL
uniref:Uncharacterized protein n=1 Tax=Arundo donax TaxID=35708 RepID=A0A0A8XQY2_ARUDO